MKTKTKLAICAATIVAASRCLVAAADPPTTDLTLWLKADAGVTLNGATVSEWADQSGLGHNAAQSVAASQPTLVTTALGNSALRFDGVNDFLNFTNNIDSLANGLTIFLVANNNSPVQTGGSAYSDSPAIFWNETASWGWVFLSPFQTNVNWRIGTTDQNNNERYARPASIGAKYSITTLVKTNTTENLYVDKVLARTALNKGFGTYGVREDGYLGRGSATYFSGDIAEVLVYNAGLSDTDRQAVEDYLYNKYLSNQQPTVAITGPAPGTIFTAPADITITADAVDDGSVTNVEFFANGVSIGSDSTEPFSIAWNGVAGGSYVLTAKATDNQGAWNVSAKAVVQVNYATAAEGPRMSGLGLWYKADAGVTSSAGKVSVWADQSGFERNAVQPTNAAQPTLVVGGNSKPAISFDGIANCLPFIMPVTGLTGLTMVVVANNTTPQTTASGGEGFAIMYWSEQPTPGWGGMNIGVFQDSATWRIGTGQSQTSTPNYPGPAVTRSASIQRNYSRTVVVKEGTSESMYTNGVLAKNVTGKLATTAYIDPTAYVGRGNTVTYFRGEIQEILVYTNALTSTDLANMETYLTGKYWAKAQPTVTLTSPANNTALTTPASITITANPADSDGTVTNVQFYDSGTLIATVTSAPWEYTLANPAKGAHTFTAKATDSDGLFNYSAPTMVFVKAASGFTLVENFENRSLGPLIYQGDWTGGFGDDQVVLDTTAFAGGNPTNKVLLQYKNNQSLAFPLLIPQGATGTLFLRVASTTWSRESIYLGLSDARSFGVTSVGDFEAQVVRFTQSSLANKKIGVRNGATQTPDNANFLSDNWYKLWLVADNSADTWKLYIQGGEYTTLTQVLQSGAGTFGFRNGVASNPLIRFLLWTSDTTRQVGGFWVDDLYLAEGENLSDPTLPQPPTLTITKSGSDVIVSWPASVSGYTLESSTSLTAPDWATVTEQQVPSGDQITVTLPASGAPKYLRLKK